MPQKAHVTSLDALEAFRSNLIIYLSQARPALDEVSADVLRMRLWLDNDQRVHWENQMRKRLKTLEQAQQALFSARIGILRKESGLEQMAVHRAREAVAGADQKLRTIKKWERDFDGRTQPLVKQMEKLHTVLSNDMVKAVAFLTQAISTLAMYAEKQPAGATPALTAPESGGTALSSSPVAPAELAAQTDSPGTEPNRNG